MNLFTSQPSSRNWTASQSSSSGWLGGSPWLPKSSAVFTNPVPKHCCQKRVTATRAGGGGPRDPQPGGEAQPVARGVGRQRRQERRRVANDFLAALRVLAALQ